MLVRVIACLATLFYIFAIVNPIQDNAIATFISEEVVFITLLFLMALFINKTIEIPIKTLAFVGMVVMPIIQYSMGQIFFFQNVGISIIYLMAFFFSILVGYNLSINYNTRQVFTSFAYTFLIAGILSGIISLCQWLHISNTFILPLMGNRPYANIAQPNLLATLLIISLLSCLYLSQEKIKSYNSVILAAFLIFCIVLTQSRTAWLVAIFTVLFLGFWQKKYQHFSVLKNKAVIAWLIYFIACAVIVPVFNQWLNVTPTATVLERATTGYLRFNLWHTIWHAILQQPWTGYGWYQTTAAQYAVSLQYPHSEWLTSAHNLFLDLLVWCGVIVGGIIVLYLLWLYFYLYTCTKNKEAVCAFLMISAVFIHAMLEYPLYYSYFLLPVGLLIGMILNENNRWELEINSLVFSLIWFVCIFILYNVVVQYYKLNANNINIWDKKESYAELFDSDVTESLTFTKIQKKSYIVKSYLFPINLILYAQILANNGYEVEAKKQLVILKKMYGIDYPYEKVLQRLEAKRKAKEKEMAKQKNKQ